MTPHVELAFAFLAITVLFLFFLGVAQLREFKRLRLRIAYLEGTTDAILTAQEHSNKLLVAFMENE
jgi:hypothetical protein